MIEFENGTKAYLFDIKTEIAADSDKNAWDLQTWRNFYNGIELKKQETYVTRRTLYNVLGVIKGETLMNAIATSYPGLADQLKPSEGGVDISHRDFDLLTPRFVDAGVITQDDADLIAALAYTEDQRYKLRNLPQPREVYIKTALERLP